MGRVLGCFRDRRTVQWGYSAELGEVHGHIHFLWLMQVTVKGCWWTYWNASGSKIELVARSMFERRERKKLINKSIMKTI